MCNSKASAYDIALGALATIAAPLVALRITVAAGAITIASRPLNVVTSALTVVALAAVLVVAWRRDVARLRRRITDLEAERQTALHAELASLTAAVHALRQSTQLTRIPWRATEAEPQTYRPAAIVGGQGDTVPLPGHLPTGLDPDTLAAARRINLRLASADQ